MRKKFMALIIVCVTLLTACGGQMEETGQEASSEQMSAQNDNGEGESGRWEFRETLLPDADETLYAAVPGLGKAWEAACDMVDGSLYRVMNLADEELVDMGICIQILEPPYTEWENIYISNYEWLDGQCSYAYERAIRADGSVCLLLKGLSDEACYRARWSREDGTMAERIPEECLSSEQLQGIRRFYMDEKDICYIADNDKIWYFHRDSTELQEWKSTGGSCIFAGNPAADGQVWLFEGSLEGENGIWTEGKMAPAFTFEDSLLGISYTSRVAFSSETEGFLCDELGIWKFSLQDDSEENLLIFRENGYEVEKIYGACVSEDGSLLVAAVSGGEAVLMEGRRGTEAWSAEEREQVELELAVTYAGSFQSFLKEAVVNYNRRSENCRIVLRTREENETAEDFRQRIQMELGTGGGPAILADDVIDFQNAVDKGILRDLTEDLAGQMADIPDNLLMFGKAEDGYYAMPYSFRVLTLVASADAVGDRESWTPEELVQCVKSGVARTAVSNHDGPWLFELLVLYGNLIDWENGKCCLNGAEAVALLETAGEYCDKGPGEEIGSRLAEGEILAGYEYISSLLDMRTMEALYQGRETYIGMPRDDGKSGSILEGKTLSVNQSCKYPEEAVAFIQYLLSEEAQRKLVENEGSSDGFPVNPVILEKMFTEEQKRRENDIPLNVVAVYHYDFYYEPQPLSEESLEKARNLLLNAEPETKTEQRTFISNVIAEETPAYFSGDKSAQSVCDTIQNRVQLYLDEGN